MLRRWYYRIKAAIQTWWWNNFHRKPMGEKFQTVAPKPNIRKPLEHRKSHKHWLHRYHCGTFSPLKPLSQRYANDNK